MIAEDKLDQIVARFEFLEAKLAEGAAVAELPALGREYAELKPVVAEIARLRGLRREREEAERLRAEPEMRDLADEELARLDAELPAAERAVQLVLLPKDAADERSAILEIRAGTGGEEAALFAADLARMYQRLAEARGWRWEVVDAAPTELGGYRELVAEVSGKGVFAALKFESGVHRVQRVPETESGGRIHTSAATVAVLPEAEEVDIDVPAAGHPHRHDARVRAPAGSMSTPPTSAVQDHPPADRHRRDLLGEVAAPEPGAGDAGAAGAALRPRARGGATRRGRPTARARSAAATGRSGSAPTTSRRPG